MKSSDLSNITEIWDLLLCEKITGEKREMREISMEVHETSLRRDDGSFD